MKFRLEELGDGKLSVVANKGGHGLWVHCETPISEKMWQAYEGTHLNSLLPGELLCYDSDAKHWFAFNLSTTDQLEDTFKWLSQAWTTKVDAVAAMTNDLDSETGTQTVTNEDGESKEPLYNPMLDMINHDFN